MHKCKNSPPICTSLTFCVYRAQYGAPQDFDEWGKIIDDDAWSWKNMSKYVELIYSD